MKKIPIALYCAIWLALITPDLIADELPLDSIQLPPGFKISLYAANVENARSLALSPDGTLFVGTRRVGNVYAVVDTDNDKKADSQIKLATGLSMPNGVTFYKGDLYIAETHQVLKFSNILKDLGHVPQPIVIHKGFPRNNWHGWRYMRLGPDKKLYIAIGAPCNVCVKTIPFATIMRMNIDGTGLEPYALGVRNSVGFDWHPQTRELWFTDNGRDWQGDDLPPDELNNAPRKGLHFGFPFRHGTQIVDPKFGHRPLPGNMIPPERELGPHVASLGMRFYTGKMFPAQYRNQIFIAEHGSWNRSEKIGYRISLVRFLPSGKLSYEVFAQGWLQDGEVWGRPVDLEIMADGSLLVSDDNANAIYRITYNQ
jgi:glucose/arabinose dehydrogenase